MPPRNAGASSQPSARSHGENSAPHRGRSGSSSNHVYTAVRDSIYQGEFGPGMPLREQDLADRLGVSRTPVREALQRLLAEGWVRRDPAVGLTVAAETIEETIESFTVMEALESVAARLAASRCTDAESVRLRFLDAELNKRLEAGDLQGAIECSSRLHGAIWAMAGNQTLQRILEGIEASGGGRHRRSGLAVEGRADAVVHEHSDIIDAIVKRDPDRADAVMRVHLQAGREARIILSLREGFDQ